MVSPIDSEIMRIEWDYNVPKDLDFTILPDPSCRICNMEKKDGVKWLSRYLKCCVPYHLLIKILNIKFGIVATDQELSNHKEHIRLAIKIDKEIQDQAKGELTIVESDLVYNIDEKKTIESCLRSLYKKKLIMEKTGELGREYIETCNQLKGWVELKLKLKKELPNEADGRVVLADIINVSGIYGQQRPNKLPEARSGE